MIKHRNKIEIDELRPAGAITVISIISMIIFPIYGWNFLSEMSRIKKVEPIIYLKLALLNMIPYALFLLSWQWRKQEIKLEQGYANDLEIKQHIYRA